MQKQNLTVMYIPKYFSFSELVASETATKKGIKNVPTFNQIKNLLTLIEKVLDPCRFELQLPITVTSGFRSPALNKAVGGVSNSQHVNGCAVDFVCADMQKAFNILAKNPHVDQLLFEHNKKGSTWIHVSISPTNKPRHIINPHYKA